MKPWLVILIFLQRWAVKEITGCETLVNASFDTTIEDEVRRNPFLEISGDARVENAPGAVGGKAARFENGGRIIYHNIFLIANFKVAFRFKIDGPLIHNKVQLLRLGNYASLTFNPLEGLFLLVAGQFGVWCSSRKIGPTFAPGFHSISIAVDGSGAARLKEDEYEICNSSISKSECLRIPNARANHCEDPVREWVPYIEIGDFSGYIDELMAWEHCAP